MSAEEFWKDDPQLFYSYRTFFINKKNKEAEEMDYKCWLQGLYNHKGNTTLFNRFVQLIHNIIACFTKSQKDYEKIETYPLKPLTQKSAEKKKENDKPIDYTTQTAIQGSIKQIYIERMKRKAEKQKNK